jgi:hypothetical protein
MIFISIERIRSLAMKISAFLTVCCVLAAVPCTRVRAQTAYREINPVDVSLHPRVGEEARVAPPLRAITKRAGSLSLWSLQPAKQPADTLFRLGKANSPAIRAVNQPGDSSSSPEALATPGASAPVHVLNGFSQNQTRQRFPKSPLFKDAFGPVALQPKIRGLRSNLELSRPELGSISSSRKSLGARSVQPTLKRLRPTSPPSTKRPTN